MKFIGVLFIVVLLVGHGPKTLPSCFIVVPYVLFYGEDQSIAWAKSRGYTDKQIAEIKRRCGKEIDEVNHVKRNL